MKNSSKIESITNHNNFLEINTDGAKFQVYLLDENIIRMRGTFEAEFPEEKSYALVKTAWDDATDNLMQDERQKVDPIHINLKQTDFGYETSTGKYTLRIYKDPFYFEIVDLDGNVVHRDLPERSFIKDDNNRSFHYSTMTDYNNFYGFGEKSGELNKFRRRMRMHNVDSLGWSAKKSDPLYKHIPFYIDFNTQTDIACGMFYNNSYDSVFDMDSEHSNYWHRYSYYACDGGDLDVFFIGGPTIKKVVEHYTDLTGKSAMMPKASLGYMGSTMFYTELKEDSDQAIIDFVDTCKENGIPCDGFFLSSGYTSGDDNRRYVFNWNKKRFPNPQDFVNELKKRGVLLAPNIKPGMLTKHPLTKQFEDNDAFIKTPDGKSSITDKYWGGQAHFVDFTSANGRQTWTDAMTKSLLSLGITSIWNDNNEYEINNSHASVDVEGSKDIIGAVRPIMSTMMSKTAQMAVKKYAPDTRPYVVSRAGFAGIQRYAQTWAGDNYTSWTNVKYNVTTILGMGLSGVANQGCDIGGIDGPLPEPELFVRWVQNGIFQPRFSIHSSNVDNTVTEPWTYPEYTKYIRDAIQLRYRLIPYFYSLLYEAATVGSPIMRPLVYEFQDDPNVAEESFEFMLGPALLVANVLDKGETNKQVYLPAGADWLDLQTNQYYKGGQTITVPVDLSSIPMFLRTGGIVPESPNLMNIHNEPIEKLQILIEPSANSTFRFYDDDGKSNDYKKGQYAITDISTNKTDDALTINFKKQGTYTTSVKQVTLAVCCPDKSPLNVQVNDDVLKRYLNDRKFNAAESGWYFNGSTRQVLIKYKKRSGDYKVTMDFHFQDVLSK